MTVLVIFSFLAVNAALCISMLLGLSQTELVITSRKEHCKELFMEQFKLLLFRSFSAFLPRRASSPTIPNKTIFSGQVRDKKSLSYYAGNK